jgi:predicted O-methyltransferase YrrM
VSDKQYAHAGSTARPGEPSRFHAEHDVRRRNLALPAFVEDASLQSLVERAVADQSGNATRSENPYALQSDTLSLLASLLAQTSPRAVVEFGSGESTKLFAGWAAPRGASVVSVEHDRRWIEDVRGRLTPDERNAVTLVHAPLRPARGGFRQFMTYRGLGDLTDSTAGADLILVDGPHISGREAVLYFVLCTCRPGAVIVVDDLRHYAVLEMVARLPASIVACFAATAINDNSHGLLVLRCLRQPGRVRIPVGDLRSVLKSYWRCLRDLREYGTGD